LEPGFLDAPEAHQTPVGDGHGIDTDLFDPIGRLQLGFEGGEEGGEGGGALVFEDDGFGEHAVTAAVLGGAEFAYGCFGATGFGAVGARGCDAEFRTHTGFSVG
jgi:hypothetical protein